MSIRVTTFNVLMDDYHKAVVIEQQQRTEAEIARREDREPHVTYHTEIADQQRHLQESIRKQLRQLVRL